MHNESKHSTPGNPTQYLTPIFESSIEHKENDDTSYNIKGSLGNGYDYVDIKYGGMGEVYLCSFKNAQEPQLALKTFQKQFFFDPIHRKAFLNEALNWLRLSGIPHVMPVMGYTQLDQRPFLVMPCVNPRDKIVSFRDKLSKKDLSLKDKLKFISQCIVGLKFVEDRFSEMIHGDLKPENLMLMGDEIFISDFGLSKSLDNSDPDLELDTTWAYKAPELWEDCTKFTKKSDLYALGIIIYETLTGSLPFLAKSAIEWKNLHSNITPENVFRKETNELEWALLELSLRCLEKEPENRPKSFCQLFTEFSRIWGEHDILSSFESLYNESVMVSSYKLIQKKLKPSLLRNFLTIDRPDIVLKELEYIEKDDFTPEIMHYKGTALSLLERDDEAAIVFSELLQSELKEDQRVNVLSEFGLSLKRLERYDEAERLYLDQLLPTISNEQVPMATTNLATVYISNKKDEEAIPLLENMLMDHPDVAEGWGNLGLAYHSKKDFNKAISCYAKTISLNRNLVFINIKLADCYIEVGQFELAYSLLYSAYSQGHTDYNWLKMMLITCGLTDRVQEFTELMQLSEKEMGEEKAKEIIKAATSRIAQVVKEDDETQGEKKISNKEEYQPIEDETVVKHDSDKSQIDDSSSISGDKQNFSTPFVNFRYYMGDSSYSIDFYESIDNHIDYSNSFKEAFNSAKRDPRFKMSNTTRLRTTIFYFTKCPKCEIDILTNRDIDKSLTCRRCDNRFNTEVFESPERRKLLKQCLGLIGLKLESASEQSVIVIVQPRKDDDIDQMQNLFYVNGYQSKDKSEVIVYFIYDQAVQRDLMTNDEPILAFQKDLTELTKSYEGNTPEEVDLFIRELRNSFPALRSASTTYDPNAKDYTTLMMIGKNKEALDALEEDLATNPEDLSLLQTKINLMILLGRKKEAIDFTEDLLASRPNESGMWYQLGKLHSDSKDFTKALTYLERAAQLDPIDKNILILLAVCYKQLGEEQKLNNTILKINNLGSFGLGSSH